MSRIVPATVTAFLLTGGIAFAASSITAHGNADQEVPAVGAPAVVSNAQSQATFKLSGDGERLSYKLNTSRIDGVRFAHIHLGKRGANGPVVAFLLPQQSPSTGAVSGRLAAGTITAADLIGPLKGKPLSDLVEAMDSGAAYTNIHTDTFPGGEVRGQTK